MTVPHYQTTTNDLDQHNRVSGSHTEFLDVKEGAEEEGWLIN